MSPWVDPTETDPETWVGSDRDSGITPVYERAHETVTPYERREQVRLSGPAVAAEFENARYEDAKLWYRIGVDSNDRLKVLVRGLLWGTEDTHSRFRVQYRREPEPTETVPFDEYDVWQRVETGTIERRDGELTFASDADSIEERTLSLSWTEMYSADQLRVAEAELVRNAALARYVLAEQDLWTDVRDTLRYNPAAFGVGP